jgi:capsular exopolysaccharide synthesis family protein
MDKLEKAVQKARAARGKELPGRAALQSPARSSHGAFSDGLLFPGTRTVDIAEEHLKSNRIVAHRTRSKEADVFRILRTQILHVMNQSGFKTIAITSPNYGDGKTTVALNLALSIALDLKQTVLLADLDLRKPNITRYLGLPNSLGLSNYLVNDTAIPECLLRLSFERLTILPSGPPLDNSSEVLGSPKMAALAHELKTRYDDRMIIYDMPPVLAQDDPIAFFPHVDAVLMVVHNGVTKVNEIKQSMHVLSRANLIGTALNN